MTILKLSEFRKAYSQNGFSPSSPHNCSFHAHSWDWLVRVGSFSDFLEKSDRKEFHNKEKYVRESA
jgi:hypothetical protein